jgi:hypothetical protein
MSFEVSSSPRTPRKSSFFQMAARRRNGDKVFITGDSRRVVERARSLLMKAARRSGLKMKEIDRMAELAAIVLENPGAPDAVLGIARAPAWDDTRQDVGVLEERFIADLERVGAILDDDDIGIDVIAWIVDWHLGWSRFWACRHPNPDCKDYFAAAFAADLEGRQPKIREIAGGRLDG